MIAEYTTFIAKRQEAKMFTDVLFVPATSSNLCPRRKFETFFSIQCSEVFRSQVHKL
jgi:hypothetical protein